MEHVVPKSKGGETKWTNVVLADKKVNNKRGNKSLEEAGLKLKKKPVEPPAKMFQVDEALFPEWEHFVKK